MRGHLGEALRILASLADATLWKWFVGLVAAAWAYVSPTGATATIANLIALLVMIDMVTGIRVAVKKGKYLQSRLWNRIVDKVLAYGSLVVLAAVIPRTLPNYAWLGPIGDFALGAACIGELISILENLSNLGIKWVKPIAAALRVRFDDLIEHEAETISGRGSEETKQ